MIEIISAAACIACDRCVTVCPANVFDSVQGRAPIIARQQDCQTCFMCEIYCPTDALYVAPDAEKSAQVREETVSRAGHMGEYALNLGWKQGRAGGAENDQTYRIRELYRQQLATPRESSS
ncbi:4Fe-4S dicluster domain-containing protein [Raoultella sp. WB_B2P2-3]|uniref:4Fe-4S dicluster domain-containing protein n=1 Tax=Raoultella scottii TaxID=3040937 RepID=A0ABU8Z1H1_9ENTR